MVKFSPPLPVGRTTVLSRTSIGLLNKLSLLYDSVWWPAEAANFVSLPTSKDALDPHSTPLAILESATIMTANMHALSPAKPPLLLLYLPPGVAKLLERHSDETLTLAAHEYITSRLSSTTSTEIPLPIAGRMVRWGSDPFSLGATTSPIALGKDAQPEDLDSLGQPLWDERLGFAGEGTDRHLRGSVPGAVSSGEREADRLIKLLHGDK